MNLAQLWKKYEPGLMRLLALAAAVCSGLTTATSGLPGEYRLGLLGVAGFIAGVERFISSQKSSTITATSIVAPLISQAQQHHV